MKECRVAISGIKCEQRGGCIIAENEGVPDGNLNLLHETFRGCSDERLLGILQAHTEGGQWAARCHASPNIAEAAQNVLDERK